MLRYRSLCLPAFLALASCTSNQPSGALKIVTGEETDVFTRAPVPATLVVDSYAWSGSGTALSSTTLATVTLPATTVDLGSQPETTPSILTVTGLTSEDAGAERVFFGATIPMDFGVLDGYQNWPVFVQRTGELARMPNPPSDTRTAPTLSIVSGRDLFVGGGSESASAATTQLYDLAVVQPYTAPPTLPVVPRSVVFDGNVGWLFDLTSAAYFDLSSGATSTISLPSGGSSSDIAGGATITDSSGVFYVVGGTRVSGVSALVLEVDTANTSQSAYANGVPTWLTLNAPRLGAAATWVAGYGLVVIGGNTTADGAGVESIENGGTVGVPGAFAADSTTGSGAAAIDSHRVLVAGGVLSDGATDAGVRVLDLTCRQNCAPTPCLASLPSALGSAQVFDIDSVGAIVVGDDLAGTTHVVRIASPDASWTSCSATEIPTKVAHTRARAVLSPPSLIVPGSFLLVGGAAGGEIEAFVP